MIDFFEHAETPGWCTQTKTKCFQMRNVRLVEQGDMVSFMILLLLLLLDTHVVFPAVSQHRFRVACHFGCVCMIVVSRCGNSKSGRSEQVYSDCREREYAECTKAGSKHGNKLL